MGLRNDSPDQSNIKEGPRIIGEFATTSTDTGLPRLFSDNYVAIGPFENQGEADECIRKRLSGRSIQFSDDVISSVGRVSGRYPHTMMILAKAVYSSAQAAQPAVMLADNILFRQAFIDTQKPLVDLAVDFISHKSNMRRQVYRSTLRFDFAFSPTEVGRAILAGNTTIDLADFAADPVQVALEDLVKARFCNRVSNDQYLWDDPLRAHALEVALG